MDSGGEGKGELNDLTPRVSRPANIAIKPSPYQNLHDPPTPTGKLADRIRRLRDRCIDALGRSAFDQAYDFLIKYVSKWHVILLFMLLAVLIKTNAI